MLSPASELKFVLRRLRRAPLFSAAAILTLALGIGANTAIFSVLEGVMLKPLPYPNPDRLVAVWQTSPTINIKFLEVSPALYFTYKEQNRTFENLGIYTGDRVSVTGLAEPEQVSSLLVSAGVLPTLGVRPLLGRSFNDADEKSGSPETVILCYGYWQRRFAGNPSIVGRRIRIDGAEKEVIGVLPATFRLLDREANLLQPIQQDRAKVTLGQFNYDGVARLKPGITLAQANADVQRMIPIANHSFPPPPGISAQLFEQARITANLRPYEKNLTGEIGPTLWLLMGTIGVVLLIACANVANLLLVRIEARHTELAIRAALGASRARAAFELLFESLTIAILGGIGGLALAFGAIRALVALAPATLPRLNEISIDAQVLLFALAVSTFTGLLFGAVPVLKIAGIGINSALREGARTVSQSKKRHFSRNVLVVVQVALALVLLISSGLMIRTFQALMEVNPGFTDAQNLQTFALDIPEASVKEPAKVLQLERDVRERLAAIPGVSAVSMTSSIPLGNNTSSDVLFARDRNYREGEFPPIRRFVFAAPGYPQVLGNRLIAGRDFTWDDSVNKLPVMMVSEKFARAYWGSPQNALHKQMREGMNDPWREIVGVVGDIYSDGVSQPANDTAYFPLLLSNFWGFPELPRRGLTFAIRSSRAGAESFMAEVRRAVWSVDPNLPLAEVRTMADLNRKSMARTTFTLVLLIIAAVMALLLGSIGIYGVIAYSVSQRTKEIGIRLALGAPQSEVSGMFVKQGVILAAIGAACGLVAAFAGMRLLEALLFGVKPVDPITYLGMLAVMLAIAALASYLPARRAASVDPAIALRLD